MCEQSIKNMFGEIFIYMPILSFSFGSPPSVLNVQFSLHPLKFLVLLSILMHVLDNLFGVCDIHIYGHCSFFLSNLLNWLIYLSTLIVHVLNLDPL